MAHKRVQEKLSETLSITGTSPFFTEETQVMTIEGYSAQITHVGSTGFSSLVNVQASNDQVYWATVGSESAAVTGTSGTSIIDVFDHNYGYTRLEITASAGSGNLNIITLFRTREE